jgi:hypothetical protein
LLVFKVPTSTLFFAVHRRRAATKSVMRYCSLAYSAFAS